MCNNAGGYVVTPWEMLVVMWLHQGNVSGYVVIPWKNVSGYVVISGIMLVVIL